MPTSPQPHKDRPARRRGRPPGSVGIPADARSGIPAMVRVGVFPHVAAQVFGISPQAFSELLSRGLGEDPSRPPTQALRAFAKDVLRARGEARVAAEVAVYQRDPKVWLTRAAPSRPGAEGWAEGTGAAGAPPPPGPGESFMERLEGARARLEESERSPGRGPTTPQSERSR